MGKRTVILVIAALTFCSARSQSIYGEDSLRCVTNRSIYVSNIQNKDYESAFDPWMYAFLYCPAAKENTFKDGPKIIKARIKVDKANKSAYVDTLMMVFDQRIKYFGKEGYVLGLKGYELVYIEKNRSEEALGYLKRSLDLEGNNASVYAVLGYMKAMKNLEKSGAKTKRDVLEAYAWVSEIIDFNITNGSRSAKVFIKFAPKIEELFTPYANCDDLITLFSQKFDPFTSDIKLLQKITKLLSDKKCTDSDLFFNASIRLYELAPSASSAYQMSKMSIGKGKSSEAISFARKAIEAEQDSNKKAKYYLALADAYRSSGSYSSARAAVYSALELRTGWGEPYINLGNIYVAGAKSCGNNFEQKTVYWVAVDAFRKALSDIETRERASKSINTYSKYFPTKESCFDYGIRANTKHNVGCWINKSTIARTSD